jgi:hypothetical protein
MAFSQRFINEFPDFQNEFYKDAIALDSNFYTATFGVNPKLICLNKTGSIVKKTDLSNVFSKIYCLIKYDNKFYLGGYKGTEISKKSVLLVLSKEGEIISIKNYELSYISSIFIHNADIFLGGNFDSPGSKSSAGLIKTDFTGDVNWSKKYQDYSNSQVSKITEINDELFLLFYGTTVGAGFTGFNLMKINSSTGNRIKSKEIETGHFEGFEKFDDTFNPLKLISYNKAIFVSCAGGSFGTGSGIFEFNTELELINTINLEGYSKSYVPLDIEIIDSSIFIGGYIQEEETKKGYIRNIGLKGNLIWHKTIDYYISHSILLVDSFIYGLGSKFAYNSNQLYYPMMLKISKNGKVYNTNTNITVKETQHCASTEFLDSNIPINISINNNLLQILPNITTPIDLPEGKYKINYSNLVGHEICNALDSIAVTNNSNEIIINIVGKKCNDLICGITATELIRGNSSRFYITCQNRGTSYISKINLKLISSISLKTISSSHPYTIINDNEIEFEIGNINPLDQITIPVDYITSTNLPLFSKHYFKIKISPKYTCRDTLNELLNSDLEISSICDKGTVRYQIQNIGANMSNYSTINIYKDGYSSNSIPLKLDSSAIYYNYISAEGQNITIVADQQNSNLLKPFKVHTIEGCGNFPNAYFSKGVNSLSYSTNLTYNSSEINMEVLDHHNGNRIFQLNKGLGYYQYLTEAKGVHEYSIRYVNNDTFKVNQIRLVINISPEFDKLKFIQIANSHKVNISINDDEVIVVGYNLNINPGDEFHFRFSIPIKNNIIDPTFLLIQAYALINNEKNINFTDAFNNIKSNLELKKQSPIVYTDKGQILGKHDAIDFYSAMHVFKNGSKLVASSYLEGGQGYLTALYFIDANEKILWEKSYAFKEGGSVINKIIEIEPDRILLFGRVEDKTLPVNYLGYSYTLVFCIDQSGKKLWEKIWRFDEVNKYSGNINFAYKIDSNAIFGGEMLTTQGYKHYYSFIDKNGELENIHPMTIKGELFTSSNGDKTILFDGYYSGPTFDHTFKIINKTGQIEKSDKISYQNLKLSIIDVILKEEEVLILGQYFSTPKDNYEMSISNFNLSTGYLKSIDVPTGLRFSPEGFLSLNNSFYISGSIYLNSPTDINVALIKIDTLGNTLWNSSEDFGSNDYAEGLIYANTYFYVPFQTQSKDDMHNLQFGYYKLFDSDLTLTNENSNRLNISIYPNPTNNYLYIGNYIHNELEYSIFDSMGNVKMKGNLETSSSVDVSALNNGLYFISIFDNKKWQTTSSFFKN